MTVDPRSPCIVGVGTQTWRADDGDAPEPLAMWEHVARTAAADSGAVAALERVESIDVVYCQTTQYDDPARRLAERLGITPRRLHYSGLGGTVPQQLVNEAATRMLAGELDVALVVGGEALATKRRRKRDGEPIRYSYRPAEKPPFPWEAPLHPAEVAHEVFQAWLTFAVFDSARRAHLGITLDSYRDGLGELWEPFSAVAALHPDAWFPVARSAVEITTPSAQNRMVGYPYTKYMVAVMDVDMAAGLLVTTHRAAEAMNVPVDRRVYLRTATYAEDPVYVAEHDELWRSPAMQVAGRTAMGAAGVGIDDIAHLDLYSCFGSSVFFACDALGLHPDDDRELTVTGGLPYHGGPGSNFMTHSIATMVDVLRNDPGALAMVSGVGMHMTKHAYGIYSTEPGPLSPPETVQADQRVRPVVDTAEGEARVAAYSVVHDRDGDPQWGLAVCELPDPDGTRCYARFSDRALLLACESEEFVGEAVTLRTDGTVNTLTR